MNIVIWIAQIVLAVLYVMAGLWKLSGKGPDLEKSMPGLSVGLIRLIGSAEALAGLGLLLPVVARNWMAVAGWAGVFLAVEAVVFVGYHIMHKAFMPAGATVVLGLLAAFVAWSRLK